MKFFCFSLEHIEAELLLQSSATSRGELEESFKASEDVWETLSNQVAEKDRQKEKQNFISPADPQ